MILDKSCLDKIGSLHCEICSTDNVWSVVPEKPQQRNYDLLTMPTSFRMPNIIREKPRVEIIAIDSNSVEIEIDKLRPSEKKALLSEKIYLQTNKSIISISFEIKSKMTKQPILITREIQLTI